MSKPTRTSATRNTTSGPTGQPAERRGAGRASGLANFDFTNLSQLTPSAIGATPPTTAAEREVFHRIQVIDRAIAAIDELAEVLPTSPAGEPALVAARSLWFGKAPQLCDAAASMIQHNDDRFEGTPLTANLVRLELVEAGRLDFLRRLVTGQVDGLAATLTIRRGEVMGHCNQALQHVEAPLAQPFLPRSERQLIERVASPVRQLVEERTQERLRTQQRNERLTAELETQLQAANDRATAAEERVAAPQPTTAVRPARKDLTAAAAFRTSRTVRGTKPARQAKPARAPKRPKRT